MFFFGEAMECKNLFRFWKIKENENPKRRFVEQETLIGVYAHVEVHTTHFLLNMQSGSSQSFVRDSGFFSLVLNCGQKQMHHDRDIDHPIGLLHFEELPRFLDTLNWELLLLHHTRQCTDSVARRQFSAHLLSRTMCKITTVSPSVLIHHSHTSWFRVNHSVFWFSKAFESKLRGSRRKQPLQVPVRLTNRWKARTTNKFGVSFPRAHIESQENHPSVCRHKAS